MAQDTSPLNRIRKSPRHRLAVMASEAIVANFRATHGVPRQELLFHVFADEHEETVAEVIRDWSARTDHPFARAFAPIYLNGKLESLTEAAQEIAFGVLFEQARPERKRQPLPVWYQPPSWWELLDAYLELGRPAIALVGPTGNGKTTTAEMALRHAGIEYAVLSCTDRTEVIDLVGGTVITGGSEEWRDGVVTRCFKEGKGIILDEADALDPRVMLSLQTALLDAGPDGDSRFVTTPEGKVYPADSCPIILTMNTYGSGASRAYTGRNKLDGASVDRLSMIETGYENEVEIIKARGYSQALAEQLVKWAQGVRQRIDEQMVPVNLSPRTLLRVAELVDVLAWDFKKACWVEFYSHIDPQIRDMLKPADEDATRAWRAS